MKALSIRQPWAWIILHGGKDIENRDWYTRVRGRILIHAAKTMTHEQYDLARRFAAQLGVDIPPPAALPRGGIVGSVDLTDCVRHSGSPWFVGPRGFLLREPCPLEFLPCRGRLGFFAVELRREPH